LKDGAALVEQAVGFSRHFGPVRAGCGMDAVLAPPKLHGEAGRIAVAHGYAAHVVSGPDREHRGDRHLKKQKMDVTIHRLDRACVLTLLAGDQNVVPLRPDGYRLRG